MLAGLFSVTGMILLGILFCLLVIKRFENIIIKRRMFS